MVIVEEVITFSPQKRFLPRLVLTRRSPQGQPDELQHAQNKPALEAPQVLEQRTTWSKTYLHAARSSGPVSSLNLEARHVGSISNHSTATAQTRRDENETRRDETLDKTIQYEKSEEDMVELQDWVFGPPAAMLL